MNEIFYLNGLLVSSKSAKVSVKDMGFLYGFGLFETMRTYNGEVFHLESHLNRLGSSAEFLGLSVNIAELEAIRTALLAVKNTDMPVRIFTDSSYAHGVLSLGWKPKKNRELINSTKKIMEKFSELKLVKVKGHVGIEGNERADFLARAALNNAE